MKKMMMILVALLLTSSSITTFAQENGSPCETSGVYAPSALNCVKFFICASNGVDGNIWHEYNCPADLEFNEQTNTCDRPETFTHGCGCNE